MKTENLSLCWQCIHAVPDKCAHGCSWSRDFIPVEGWNAQRADLKGYSRCVDPPQLTESYKVISCPQFEEG